jgi:hypothetical protein
MAVVAAAQRQRSKLKIESATMDVDRFASNLLKQGLVQTTKSFASIERICDGHW